MDLPPDLCEITLDKNIIIHRMLWKAGKPLGHKTSCFSSLNNEDVFQNITISTLYYLINMQKYQPLQTPNNLNNRWGIFDLYKIITSNHLKLLSHIFHMREFYPTTYSNYSRLLKWFVMANPYLSLTKTSSYKSYLAYIFYAVPQYFIYFFYAVPQKCSSTKTDWEHKCNQDTEVTYCKNILTNCNKICIHLSLVDA